MRLKSTVANLLLLTVIAAMGTQRHRDYVRMQELTAELALQQARRDALHKAVRDVKLRKLELQAAVEQLKPELLPHQRNDFRGQLLVNTAGSMSGRRGGPDLLCPAGARRMIARIRKEELRVLRAREYLKQLERTMSQSVSLPQSRGAK